MAIPNLTQGTSFSIKLGKLLALVSVFVDATAIGSEQAYSQCSASGTLSPGTTVSCGGAQTTIVGQGPGADNVTITATDGSSVKVTNSNAISVGNQSAIILGSSGPAPGGSAANAPVVVQTTTNASAGSGRYGDGSNTIDIGSNSTVLINRNASVISTGTQGTSEAINPYGFGNTITNYGLIQGGPSTAIWFQDVGPANSARNVVNNFGIITAGQALGSSGNIGIDFINEAGAKVIGNLQFAGGDDRVTLNPGSSIAGNLDGGSGKNLLTLNASGSSADVLSGKVNNFETLDKTGAGAWTLTGTIGNNTATGSSPLMVNVIGGTLILTGVNTAFNGSVVINPGVSPATAGPDPSATLEASAQSLPPTITDHGILLVNQVTPGVYAGVVNGTGVLSKIGNSTLTLNGASTYSGGTDLNVGAIIVSADNALGTAAGPLTFNGGTLRFNSNFNLSSTRAITLNGANGGLSGGGTIDTNGHSTTISQTISGVGGLTATNSAASPGFLILTGANGYLGGTTISGGTLQLGAGGTTGSVIGNITDNSALAFARADALVFSGAISGAGSVTQLGSGATIFDADNSYTGGTTIAAGTLQLGEGSATGKVVGNVADYGTLVFDHSNVMTFAGVISGSGGIAQVGSGTVVLNAVNGFAGPTIVEAGTLAIGDAMHSAAALSGGGAVSVASHATLGGYGEIAGFVANNGTLAAGNALPAFAGGPVGEFRISGDVLNAGTIDLVGSSIGNALAIGGNYATGPSGGALALNTFLNAGGPLSNQITDRLLIAGSAIGNTMIEVRAIGLGAPTSVDVTRPSDGISLVQVAGTSSANAFSLAGGYLTGGTPYQYRLNAYGPGSSNGLAAASQSLVGNPGAFWDYRLQSVYLSEGRPEVAPQIPAYIAAPNALFNAGLQDLGSLHRRLGEIRDDQIHGVGQQYEVFARSYGGSLNYTSDRSFDDYGFNSVQDYAAMQLGGNWIAREGSDGALRLGTAFAVGRLWFQPRAIDGASQGSLNTYNLLGTATWLSRSGWYVDAILSGGAFDGPISTQARGQTTNLKGQSYAASVESGYPMPLGWGGLSLEPQVQLVYQQLDFEGRTDIDLINVSLGDPNQGIFRAGARLTQQFAGPNGLLLTPYLKASLLQGIGGGNPVNLGDVAFPTGRFGTALQAVGGMTGSITNKLSIFGEVAWQQNVSVGGSRGWTANLGMRSVF
jgi:outer membrane autotransporter protein